MRYRRLGGTGLVVSELCLGTMTFGNGEDRFKPVAGVDQAGADALVERASRFTMRCMRNKPPHSLCGACSLEVMVSPPR